jgi:hypothetical protein
MKVFTCTGFEGHYPVGTAAVVVEETAVEAAYELNTFLMQSGLPGGVTAEHMREVPMERGFTHVLCNGDY